jgi:hypothetical protein
VKIAVNPRLFAVVCGALVDSDARSAVKFVDAKTVVRATWRYKPTGRDSRRELIVTFGAPNYAERRLIKGNGPMSGLMSNVQFRAWPRRRK